MMKTEYPRQDITERLDMVRLYTDISADENIGKYFRKPELKIVRAG